MCQIFYSTYADALMYQGSSCRGYTLLLQLLKSKNSVQNCFEINNTGPRFASRWREHVQIITFTHIMILARMRR